MNILPKSIVAFFSILGLLSLNIHAQSASGVSEKVLMEGERYQESLGGVPGEWHVTAGSVTVQAPSSDAESGIITFGSEGTTLRFNFKQPIDGNVDLSFDLNQHEGTSNMSTFRVFVFDAEGKSFQLAMSTVGPHYGQDGISGFAIFNSEDNVRIGYPDEHLRTDIEPQKIRFLVEPGFGASFYYDEESSPMIIFQDSQSIGPVTAIELRARQDITWQVQNVDLKVGE